MEILEVTENKEQYLEILSIAGEQEEAILAYLNKGILFTLYEDFDLKSAAVILKEDNDTYEIKNIAAMYQGKGYESEMIKYIIKYCKGKSKKILVNTGDNETLLIFFEKLGFSYSHAVQEKIYHKLEF
jgi:GNAT superfamily N-acetyltransferase